MTFPPPSHYAQSSIASGADKPAAARPTRSQQSAWGSAASHPSARRNLTLATNLPSPTHTASPSRRPPQSQSPAPSASAATSPLHSSFSAIISPSRFPPRNNSPASTPGPFSTFQSGGQHHSHNSGQGLASPKSRVLTPSSATHLASAASGGGSGGGGGGGVGAGVSRGATFFPFAMATSSNAGLSSGQSSLSKISVAQVFLLLDSINQKEGKDKWETKAAQIHKLVDSNGMDVYSKYFCRLLTGNAPQIFPGINKVVENAGNYPLLVQEIQKVSQDFDQARKIADTIDGTDTDIFRDFDLATFLDHFQLDPIVKAALALAFSDANKTDLRAKADAILLNSMPHFLTSLSSVSDTNKDLSPSFLATIVERLLLYRNLDDDSKRRIAYAARLRYQALKMDAPAEVEAALQVFPLSDPRLTLVRQLQARGPRASNSQDALLETMNMAGPDAYSEEQVATALLFMVICPNYQQYSPEFLVTAVQKHHGTQSFSWSTAVRYFDREGMRIDGAQFTRLFNVLLPVAQEDPRFDIQSLWGGEWVNKDAQFSFLAAFLTSDVDTSKIPNYRTTFSPEIFSDASEMVRQQAEQAQHSPLRSHDAIAAIFNLVFLSSVTWSLPESQGFVKDILQPGLPIFLCSAFAIPQPWTNIQYSFVIRSFVVFVSKRQEGYQFALHGVWKLDRQWVAEQLFHVFTQDSLYTGLIYEHALEHGWLDYLLSFTNGLAMDLASLAHQRDNFDLEQWVKSAERKTPIDMGGLLAKFLRIKADDELRVQRKEQPAPLMVSLAVKTVHTLLMLLDDYPLEHEILVSIQRLCLQTYPRLVNYGEGFDDIIDSNGAQSNAIPEAVDKQMQGLFEKMYHEELSLREVLELMRRYKTSRDPSEQDLFTCMVHSLIDEYHCYHEYPLEALTKTAVMFGGIINFKLISGVPLKVGLGMILDAVRDHQPNESMFKFGVEAIEQLISRLPEWPGFCTCLLQIPNLQGTPIYKKAKDVLREQGHSAMKPTEDASTNGATDGLSLSNGNVDSLVASVGMRKFRSLHFDPPLRPEIYRPPDEEVHDKILFTLNNVSEQNIKAKLKDLQEVLRDEHHQWFAEYLVEERAKLQPNFQQLYLELLDLIDDKMLWAEVLRETYVSAIRLLNAESTLNSTTDRTHLKNLGGWLGSLTIAKDKPIKHKNIYFKDLLIEAFDTQRLMVAIPFTCKVLAQAMKSTIFKPPNPWLMDILALLMEIYHFAELKMILKFEIEVLCGDLELDYKTIEPSTCIRERPPQLEDGLPQAGLPDGLEGFDEMALAGMNRAVRPERISPAAMISSLPNLDQILVFPPTASTMVDPNILKQIVLTAVERAIAEIIAPVVERSITIASISTAQLILKDFAMEPDEEKVRQAAATMVRALAGSLALVTCKEPLKMSMTNYIRMIQHEYSEQPMPEGLVLMCVNDNLDAACGIVEKAAEEKSIPEIEKVIESQLEARRRHRASRPNEPFIDSSISRWGFFIPEPYRLTPGGLNKEQLAIYEDFARQSRGAGPSHIQHPSTDSGKQVMDALQEPFPAIPNLSTPAEQPAIPHQMGQGQQEGSLQPSVAGAHPQVNGFAEASPRDKVEGLVTDLQQAARNVPEEHVKDLPRDTPLLQHYNQVLRALLASPNGEELARFTAIKICNVLYTECEKTLEIEVLVHLLTKLCELSPLIARTIWSLLAEPESEQILNPPVTLALIDAGLMELYRVDVILSRMIDEKNKSALELLSSMMDRLLLNDEPSALRSDFSASLGSLSQWMTADPELAPGKEIIRKLRESGIPEVVNPLLSDQLQSKRDQIEYIFSEWLTIYKYPPADDRTYSVFLKDMHQRQVINNQEDIMLFMRLLVDLAVATSEHEYPVTGNVDEIFLHIDALAKLIVLLIKFQGEDDGAVKANKPAYLDSILSLLVLVLNHHQIMRGENFNQRAFFRLFSSILCEYVASGLQQTEQHKEMMLVFSDRFLSLQPKHVPGFAFGWLALVSHRIFMAGMLMLPEQAGWKPYCHMMEVLLSYVGEQHKSANVPFVAKDIYKGALRVLLILHHDFPEFVAENHFQLCNVIPAHCTQLRNLVLSAYPSSFQKLPDPFRDGLKVDRLEEIRQAPKIAGDIVAPLQNANIKSAVDNALKNSSATDRAVQQICEAVYNPTKTETGLLHNPIGVDVVLLHALVLYIGQSAVSSASQKSGSMVFSNTPQLALLEKLSKTIRPEARYYFLGAMANQLRYPNSHTHYFSYVIFHLFGLEQPEQQGTDIREQIVRVLLERLIVHRPHPWGLIITLQELLQNPTYSFFNLPFIQAAPEICRLFDALVQHIQQQSPRPLT